MAKTKKELLEQLAAMGIEDVNPKLKIAELEEMIATAQPAEAEAPVEELEITESAEEPKVAKAGKRSAKALAEAEEAQAKEERKASGEAAEKPKAPVVPTRSRLERRGKGFLEGKISRDLKRDVF